jgi:hypothetical protein
MPKATTLFLGLNVHKEFITVAHAEAHRSDLPVFMESIGNRQGDIDGLVRRLHGKTARLVFAYEAGPSRPIAWGHKRDNCLFASSE